MGAGTTPGRPLSPFVIPRLAAGEHEIEILAVHPPVRGRDGELLEPLYEPVPAHYEIKILTDGGRLREIKIDARTGAVIEIEDE